MRKNIKLYAQYNLNYVKTNEPKVALKGAENSKC